MVREGVPYAKVRRWRPGRDAWSWSGLVLYGGYRWHCRCPGGHPTRQEAEGCAEAMAARLLRMYDQGC